MTEQIAAPEPNAADPNPPEPDIIDVSVSKPLWAPFRWIRDLVQGRVELYILSYRDDLDSYVIMRESVRRKNVPIEAVHVTGRGQSAWFLDLVHGSKPPAPGHGTAIDLFCWFKNNSLDRAMSVEGKTPLDKKMLTYLAIGGAAAVICLWYYLA